ncbi:MAG: SAM-dependent methyltransferase [Pseudomonadota bacterium]|nr:SAM-dependent methyltransferase [Pseudomonadota bacterium]
MTVAQYMALALTHPEHGYYMHHDPLGARGDFITAPEISQIFGEVIGAWLGAQWLAMGRPRTALVELGPGRGTLMADALRATRGVPGFHEAISVHLIEASPTLKQKQWNALAGKHPEISWHEDFSDIPEKALLLIANEFFDALPIRQYVHLQDGWHERMVTLDANGNLAFSIAADAGRVVERCEYGKEWMAMIARRMMQYGGAGLVIDYGYNGPPKNSRETLQAMRHHNYVDVLSGPGTADLTAHVDFHALAQAAREEGAAAYGPGTQGDFLKKLGAEPRTEKLCEKATPDQKIAMISGLRRLTSVDQMGELFKVLCIAHPQHPKPEGF